MNEVIDLAFIAAKVAAMRDEKARMIVGGASLVYNVSQIARFKAMIVEFSQLCNYIVCVARFRAESKETIKSEECISNQNNKM